jgi:hypothetical protein
MIKPMKKLACVLSFLTFVSLGALSACGDDSGGGADAAAADSGNTADAPAAQSDAANACDDFCPCEMANCPTEFGGTYGGDLANCMTTCNALPAATAQCRAYHCSVATGTNAALHCPHTAGMGGFCQ